MNKQLQKVCAGIICGLLAILCAPIIVLLLSTGTVIVGYTKMSMGLAFIWGYACGYTGEMYGHIDNELTQQNIRLQDQCLERTRRMRELAH